MSMVGTILHYILLLFFIDYGLNPEASVIAADDVDHNEVFGTY